jgi:hypothetical protein
MNTNQTGTNADQPGKGGVPWEFVSIRVYSWLGFGVRVETMGATFWKDEAKLGEARPPLRLPTRRQSLASLRASWVFREGAEYGARGGRAPHSNFGIRGQPSCSPLPCAAVRPGPAAEEAPSPRSGVVGRAFTNDFGRHRDAPIVQQEV